MDARQQLVELRERPEHRLDVLIVADVVARVVLRRGVDRREPDDVHAQLGQMIQVRGDAAQITDPVAVGVREAPRVDLVDDRALEPAHAAADYGSQRKRRTATNRPTAVQITSANRSLPWNWLPVAPGTKHEPKALTMCDRGKKCETLTSQSGAPSSGNQMPEMNETGRKVS